MEIDGRDEPPRPIKLPQHRTGLFGGPTACFAVPLSVVLAHHSNLGLLDRFAEQVVATHLNGRILTSYVVRSVGFYLDREGWQRVAAYANIRPPFGFAVAVSVA